MSNLAEKITSIKTPSMEENIRENMMAVVKSARSLVVADDISYQMAAATLKLVFERKKQVQNYWKEPKESAAKSHKVICAKEKEMLNPLTDAEGLLKKSMGDYSMKLEAKRRVEAAEIERLKKTERDRFLADAIAAEQTGDVITVETSLMMAEMVEDMKAVSTSKAMPKADGISIRKTWKARVIDDSKVPSHVVGVCIRPVDMSALNNLARMTKGTAEIPGVEFYEDTNLAVR